MSQEKRLLVATGLSMIILLGWNWFYEQPRLQKTKLAKAKEASVNISKSDSEISTSSKKSTENAANSKKITEGKHQVLNDLNHQNTNEIPHFKTRQEAVLQTSSKRIKISNHLISGSISLQGARFDDLELKNYFENEAKKDPVALLAPAESSQRYFADFGWVGSDVSDLPNPNSLWQAVGGDMSEKDPLVLSYKNKDELEFLLKISLDEDYVFTIQQIVKNHSKQEMSLAPYGRIERNLANSPKSNYILLEGTIGVFNKVLQEQSYESLAKIKNKEFSDIGGQGGWLGITDKYWLTALIPDKSMSFNGSFLRENKGNLNLYKVSFIGEEAIIKPQSELQKTHHLFAGAKKVGLLDQCGKKFELTLFDRAIDFGWFYFLTRPFFSVINFLNKIFGNFGLAILAMTVLVKLALFPMASKSFAAIARMKVLHPKIEEIRSRFKDDKMQMNREIMELYKREKINPAAGCLPLLIQIPVFFALYKVLFVTLDMRHAPFYGWIHDLSAPDPTSIFNLFGLLPFAVKPPFMIGVWPLLMGLTMIWQQKLNPPPSDPTQATVMRLMPYVLTFILAAFPAGLVIYWTWSNLLSIAQQIFIAKKHSISSEKSAVNKPKMRQI